LRIRVVLLLKIDFYDIFDINPIRTADFQIAEKAIAADIRKKVTELRRPKPLNLKKHDIQIFTVDPVGVSYLASRTEQNKFVQIYNRKF